MMPMARMLISLLLCCSFLGVSVYGHTAPPSNDRVGNEVDEIIKNPKYDWLRKGGKETSPSTLPPHGKTFGKGGSVEGGMDPESSDGCTFEPNFQDLTPTETGSQDDGCGNSDPGDCACAPDLGNCACEPIIGNCGACAPTTGSLAPVGYGVGILALALIIFFVVRALIGRLPEEDTAIEDEEYDELDDEEIRVSRIHQLDSTSLLDKAHAATRAGDYKKAVGYLYLLAIVTLSKAGYVELEQSTTNWHIAQQIRKNGGPIASINIIIRQFEDLFFGNYVPCREQFDICLKLVENDVMPLGQGPVEEGGTYGN